MQNIYSTLKHKALKHTVCPKAVDRSIHVLHYAVEFHRGVMASILGQAETGIQVEETSSASFSKSLESELREALLEAIEVLEERDA